MHHFLHHCVLAILHCMYNYWFLLSRTVRFIALESSLTVVPVRISALHYLWLSKYHHTYCKHTSRLHFSNSIFAFKNIMIFIYGWLFALIILTQVFPLICFVMRVRAMAWWNEVGDINDTGNNALHVFFEYLLALAISYYLLSLPFVVWCCPSLGEEDGFARREEHGPVAHVAFRPPLAASGPGGASFYRK